jgi:hypothetical protein
MEKGCGVMRTELSAGGVSFFRGLGEGSLDRGKGGVAATGIPHGG